MAGARSIGEVLAPLGIDHRAEGGDPGPDVGPIVAQGRGLGAAGAGRHRLLRLPPHRQRHPGQDRPQGARRSRWRPTRCSCTWPRKPMGISAARRRRPRPDVPPERAWHSISQSTYSRRHAPEPIGSTASAGEPVDASRPRCCCRCCGSRPAGTCRRRHTATDRVAEWQRQRRDFAGRAGTAAFRRRVAGPGRPAALAAWRATGR